MHATDQAASPSGDAQQPTQQEIDHIVQLHENGEHAAMEQASLAMLELYPESALAWSVMGMALPIQGKDAVLVLQKAAALAPDDAEAHFRLTNAQLDNGQPELAVPALLRALEIAPGYAEALSRLGDALQAQGHLKEAAECYRGALEIDPSLLTALAGKGDIQQAQGHYQAAQASYQQALVLAPEAAELHRKLGDLHVILNRPEAAMRSYAAALQSEPDYAMAHAGMGNVLFRLDRNAEAAISYRKATTQPGALAAHYHGLGLSLHASGETAEAEQAYRQAIAMDATLAAPMLHYADLLRETRRPEPAIAVYQAALLLEPDNINPLNNLGKAFQDSGQVEQALASFRQILQLQPDNAVTHNNIAAVLNEMGQSAAALESCRRAIKLNPKSPAAHANLATCLMEMGKLDEAIKAFETVVRLDPHNRKAHINIGATLARLGRIDQAIKHARHALKIDPDWDELHSNLLFYLTHSQDADPKSLFVEHLQYANRFEAPLRASWPEHSNTRDPERRLRIGFVSADLYNHAVANFITPVLEHLAQSPQLEIFAYANSFHDDVVSRHLHGLVSVWRQVEKLTHAELAQLITSDAIDILIDLSGHTGFNRLPVFARKPAPLQISWIGYPGTTGLQSMDYFLTDRYYSPPGALDDQFTEKLLRLPATAPFLPSSEAPPVSPAPALENGHITFGSFNRPGKLNRKVIARWSKLLRMVPNAKMVLAAMPNKQTSDMLRSWFASEGITAGRLTFHEYTNMRDYLALHGQVDLCLETHPYTSGTTGFHALWMGVPTLTMTGATLPSRVGANILGHAGLDDFIAQDKADFLRKGVALAGRLDQLAALRSSMRTRMSNSALGQPALIAAGLDNALRQSWQRWCADLPPVSFDADPAQSSLSKRAASMQSLHEVNVDAALLLAIDHHQANRLPEAETLYMAILHKEPGHVIVNHNMGLLANQLGFAVEAIAYLSAAHHAAPDEVQFCVSYVQALQRHGSAPEALKVLAAAMARNAGAPVLQSLHEQMARVEETAQQPSQAEAEHIFALYETGQHGELEAAARALVSRYPASGFAWSVLGTALQVQGKDALSTLQTAVSIAPQDAQAHGNLGNAWQSAGQYAMAIDSYRQAIVLDPVFADAYCNMAGAQKALGLLQEAAQSCRQALAIAPSNEIARQLLHALEPGMQPLV